MEEKVEYRTQVMGVPVSTATTSPSLQGMAVRVNELVQRAHAILNGPELAVGERSTAVTTTVEEQLELVSAELHEGIAGLEKLCERLSILVERF